MQPGSGDSAPEAAGPAGEASPVARMMMAVAGHAITGYVQFRALVELLIAKGVITRQELEQYFSDTREADLHRTIDEWFPEDIAYHIKMAIQSQEAAAASYQGTTLASDADEVAQARAMQSGDAPPTP